MTGGEDNVLVARNLRKIFQRESGETVAALDDVSLNAKRGTLTALVGPDGAGKTTFIRLVAGLLKPEAGGLIVLGLDVNADPQAVQDRVAYMPQRFGLYDDLTVQENLDLYADLHGIVAGARRAQYARLMEMTALGPFTKRLAGQLSGGMKQKLGLACALIQQPELMLLDEPTAGVDPLSRHELWQIILRLVHDQQVTVLLSTSYLDEAERCSHAVVLHDGKVLAQARPKEIAALAAHRVAILEPALGERARNLQTQMLNRSDVIDAVPQGGRVRVVYRNGAAVKEAVVPRFEDGFMVLLHARADAAMPVPLVLERAPAGDDGGVAVEVRNLVRKFGAFTAVNDISFEVPRGEIFGLLGPNGAGKTTTFRMLCGLLPTTSGTLKVAGADLRTARASARQNIGYVAQRFSLYGQLSVLENLEFFASAYGLRGHRRRARIAWAIARFELDVLKDVPSQQIPGGYKQRLAMAVAMLHEPQILFLDEPTSGADPLARREFWQRISVLSRQGVTVIVTTHFMEEAEYCDRVAILDSGTILAQGTPAEIRGREATMEDAFVAIVEEARRGQMRPREPERVA